MALLTGLFLLLPIDLSRADNVGYYEIKTDSKGQIVPWYSEDPAAAYDFVIRRVWDFWKTMKTCPNGVKYYMQHQVWTNPDEDSRGIGGDQIAMALSSWSLLYAYLGDASVTDNMRYMADYYIEHSFSPPTVAWPNLPFPYNFSGLHTGTYDGDMKAGKGFLQPDKAGSFASELLTLYKMTGTERYLKTAVTIADVLAAKVVAGDANSSPWPYRVHAETGTVSLPYTTNWTGALRLFEQWKMDESGPTPVPVSNLQTVIATANLAQAIRSQGYLAADLNPLFKLTGDPSLTLEYHNLREDDLHNLSAQIVNLASEEKAGKSGKELRPLRCRPRHRCLKDPRWSRPR